MCLEKAKGSCEKDFGMWKIQPTIFQKSFLPFVLLLFSLGVTGNFELKLFIKITKLKEKYEKKANSILKKCGSSLSNPGSKW